MTRYIYGFDEPLEGGRDLLGGKGIGLAEMTQLGVPVPAGFTITTDACRAYMASGGEVEGLDEEIADYLARLEEQTGRRFGDPKDPLLRSEEHTSELQSHSDLVCRLLLEKKKKKQKKQQSENT